MKLLWTSSTARHGRQATARREQDLVAQAQHQAEALRRAQRRSAQVAAAVASIPEPRRPLVTVPAQRSRTSRSS